MAQALWKLVTWGFCPPPLPPSLLRHIFMLGQLLLHRFVFYGDLPMQHNVCTLPFLQCLIRVHRKIGSIQGRKAMKLQQARHCPIRELALEILLAELKFKRSEIQSRAYWKNNKGICTGKIISALVMRELWTVFTGRSSSRHSHQEMLVIVWFCIGVCWVCIHPWGHAGWQVL